MKFESRMRTLSRRMGPPRPKEIICHWIDSIFSTKGWEIGFDKNGVPYSKGDVPPEYTHDMIKEPSISRNPETEPRV